MNLGELIRRARRGPLEDVNPQYHWSDDDLIDHLNEAQMEVCRRTHCLVSSSRHTVDIDSSEQVFSLPSGIIAVRRVRVDGFSVPLKPVSYRDLDELFPGWEGRIGTPRFFYTDSDTGYIGVYPRSDRSSTLMLTTVCEPRETMTAMDDEPEIAERFQFGFGDWVAYRCFSKPDPDTCDPKKAERHLFLFEEEYGRRSSAKNEVFESRNVPIDNYDGSY